MKVLQLIDSLAVGGAERVSVNLANALSQSGVDSYLCASRSGGPLAQFIAPQVRYRVLHKSRSTDIAVFLRLLYWVREERIDLVHAHSSSLYWAMALRLATGCAVVWHNHFGGAVRLRRRDVRWLRRCASRVDHAVVVNRQLERFAIDSLGLSPERVTYLPNFPELAETASGPPLPGTPGRRIVVLANLRHEKDHAGLLEAFSRADLDPDWSLLLVGHDYGDAYSLALHSLVSRLELKSVHFLGARIDIASVLAQCDIAVLGSHTEGLPVALLEYGLASLPVVVTRVGEMPTVVQDGSCGLLVEPADPAGLAEALRRLADSVPLREELGTKFRQRVQANYSRAAAVDTLLKIYRDARPGRA